MIKNDGSVKLADFGYAKILTREASKRKTTCGTSAWMAPEVIMASRRTSTAYDSKVDIWSLGITAMELADGDAPYITEHPNRIMFNIVHSNPPQICERWHQHPEL